MARRRRFKKNFTPPGKRGKVDINEGKGSDVQDMSPDSSGSYFPKMPAVPAMPTMPGGAGAMPPRPGLGVPDEDV